MIKHNIGIVDNKHNKYKFFDATKWIDDTARIYMFISARNIGKTTWMWNKILDDFFNKGLSSIFMRRSKTEIDSYKSDITKILTIVNNRYGYEMYLKGNTVWYNKQIVLELISLSTAYNKSSGNFDNVNALYFDEVMSRNGYLNGEYNLFTNFVATCERHNDEFKVFMFGNALTKNNPYMSQWGLWDTSTKIMVNGFVKVVMIENGVDVILPSQTNTLAYALSGYDKRINDYMYGNKFAYDDDSYVKFAQQVKEQLCNVKYRIILDGEKYEVYTMSNEDCWIVNVINWSSNSDLITTYALTTLDGILAKVNSKRKRDLGVWLYRMTVAGNLWYNSESTRTAMLRYAAMWVDREDI